MPTVFRKTLVRAIHVRSFEIIQDRSSGWNICEREDERILRAHHYRDWHHVELAALRMKQAVADLCGNGWQELPG